MTAKELIKLAAACRKAGIIRYRSGDTEFTLGEPQLKIGTQPKESSANLKTDIQGTVEDDALSEAALLFWSTNPDPETGEELNENISS
jgi:hypothetical protein